MALRKAYKNDRKMQRVSGGMGGGSSLKPSNASEVIIALIVLTALFFVVGALFGGCSG